MAKSSSSSKPGKTPTREAVPHAVPVAAVEAPVEATGAPFLSAASHRAPATPEPRERLVRRAEHIALGFMLVAGISCLALQMWHMHLQVVGDKAGQAENAKQKDVSRLQEETKALKKVLESLDYNSDNVKKAAQIVKSNGADASAVLKSEITDAHKKMTELVDLARQHSESAGMSASAAQTAKLEANAIEGKVTAVQQNLQGQLDRAKTATIEIGAQANAAKSTIATAQGEAIKQIEAAQSNAISALNTEKDRLSKPPSNTPAANPAPVPNHVDPKNPKGGHP
ncbi:MAG TPA: hypothetical protein VG326_05530 [Tepidisphaeraceae bacterium]|nr:hypothetical protein [Tepidisphaeraceae bacterium]